MSFLAACESRKYPSTGRKASKGGKRNKSSDMGDKLICITKKMKGNEDYHPA